MSAKQSHASKPGDHGSEGLQIPTVRGGSDGQLSTSPGRSPVSVLVPTLNEAADLPGCLTSVAFADQVCVVDSGSTDATAAIAEAAGAEVHRFEFQRESPSGWPKKRNWALDNLPLRHRWVLLLDADERVTPELASEIDGIVRGTHRSSRPGDGHAFWVNRRMIFHGRWVKHGGYYPAWNLRLFERNAGRFERLTDAADTRSGDMEVHEHVRLAPEAGEAGFLDHDLLHHEIGDFAEWVEKHNRYSSWEAAVAVGHGTRDGIEPKLTGTPQQRRRWLKHASKRLPFRPTLRFGYHYLLRQGFREGRLGLDLARLMAAYESITIAKTRELRLRVRPSDA